MSFKQKYLVTNIPWYFLPIVLLLSYAIGIIHAIYFFFVFHTSKIEFIGEEKLEKDKSYIFGIWHTNVYIMFTILPKIAQKQVWMQHPFWYMKPVHATLTCVGVDYVLGSTGHGGQEAANTLVQKLKEGYSTAVFPDGPNGPPKTLKKGLLHMSQQSGVPVVPLKAEVKRFFSTKTWDTKCIPLPFNHIKITVGDPRIMNVINDEVASQFSSEL